MKSKASLYIFQSFNDKYRLPPLTLFVHVQNQHILIPLCALHLLSQYSTCYRYYKVLVSCSRIPQHVARRNQKSNHWHWGLWMTAEPTELWPPLSLCDTRIRIRTYTLAGSSLCGMFKWLLAQMKAMWGVAAVGLHHLLAWCDSALGLQIVTLTKYKLLLTFIWFPNCCSWFL